MYLSGDSDSAPIAAAVAILAAGLIAVLTSSDSS